MNNKINIKARIWSEFDRTPLNCASGVRGEANRQSLSSLHTQSEANSGETCARTHSFWLFYFSSSHTAAWKKGFCVSALSCRGGLCSVRAVPSCHLGAVFKSSGLYYSRFVVIVVVLVVLSVCLWCDNCCVITRLWDKRGFVCVCVMRLFSPAVYIDPDSLSNSGTLLLQIATVIVKKVVVQMSWLAECKVSD